VTIPPWLKVGLYGLLGAVGTLAAVLYALGVAPAAKTSLDTALLVFECAAAVIGFLGLILIWRSYRLQVGRVPRPDLAVLDDGKPTKRWEIQVALLAALDDNEVAARLARESDELEASIADVERSRAKPRSGSILNLAFPGTISDADMTTYRTEVSKYLQSYENHLRDKRAFDALSARAREVVFAFTNDRAGVPAEGVQAIIHVPDDVRVVKPSKFPIDPGMPGRPTPPRAYSMFDTLAAINRGLDMPSIALSSARSMPAMARPRNVSAPTIRSGSTGIKFAVDEILHNLGDDSSESPLVLVFPQPGTWTIPYEMHARNLPTPKRGHLTITVTAVTTAKDV
jgi:hypothetical protein